MYEVFTYIISTKYSKPNWKVIDSISAFQDELLFVALYFLHTVASCRPFVVQRHKCETVVVGSIEINILFSSLCAPQHAIPVKIGGK